MYYNTPNDSGEELRRNQKKAETNVLNVLLFYKQNKEKTFTKSEACKEMKKQGFTNEMKLEQSISVALNTLLNKGFVIKLSEKRMGSFGVNCHCWIYNSKLEEDSQSNLF